MDESSCLNGGSVLASVTLIDTPYFFAGRIPGTPVFSCTQKRPLPPEDWKAAVFALSQQLHAFERGRHDLLCDLRAVAGASDAAATRWLSPLINGFRRAVVLVEASAHRALVEEALRQSTAETAVFSDEGEAFRWLRERAADRRV